MSQVYAPSRDGKVAMWREMRSRARAVGDAGVVRMTNVELGRLGALETTEAVNDVETAVPERPKRGRRPKPRCEHDMILDRCPDCSPEQQVA